MSDGFSEYLVFVDESGDHGLDTIIPALPSGESARMFSKQGEYGDAD